MIDPFMLALLLLNLIALFGVGWFLLLLKRDSERIVKAHRDCMSVFDDEEDSQ